MEQEIEELKNTLQNYEDTDPGYMGEEMKSLSHYVSFTHMRMEESLGHLITRDNLKVFMPEHPPYSEDIQSAFSLGTASLTEVDFYRKVDMSKSRDLIDGGVKQAMDNVNRLRNWFAHPSKFRAKLDMLKTNRAEYKKALEELIDAHQKMNTIFSRFLAPTS